MAYKRFVKHFLKFFVHTNKKKDLNCFISSVNTKMFVRHLTFLAKKKVTHLTLTMQNGY